ncbi:MAG TPA: hypothetical protein VEU33_24685 [Archangium sp.]|nr:hypothetical protein [Archangium sp.]
MTIAVYAGSFDPVTAGHLSVIRPAESHLAEVSSSRLKEKLARGEDVSDFCPPAVAAKLRSRSSPPSLRSP